MTLVEVKKGLLDLLKTKYPTTKYAYYGADTKEGYKKPSFFVQLRPTDISKMNRNIFHFSISVYITYFQKTVDEVDMLQKVQEIQELLALGFSVGNRFVDVYGYDFDYVGQDRNILEISFEMEWQNSIRREEEAELMKSLFLLEEIKETEE